MYTTHVVSRSPCRSLQRVLCSQSPSQWQKCRLSTFTSGFLEHISHASAQRQIYRSQSRDPFFNLAVERLLLDRTPANATVLFCYVNRPCVVIGRNQNPWLEVNLSHLRSRRQPHSDINNGAEIDLVRRHSGGGTVFHDEGNVNTCAICPPADFTRDKHLELIIRALRPQVPSLQVNDRHDLVLETSRSSEPTLKVSGSAYKLTRHRALHHATCLVDSPYLGQISSILRSPAAPFMSARGVDSVRSPVGNLWPGSGQEGVERFTETVIAQWAQENKIEGSDWESIDRRNVAGTQLTAFEGGLCGLLDEDLATFPEIAEIMHTLQSPTWIYEQTPLFSFSTQSADKQDSVRSSLPASLAGSIELSFTARHGVLDNISLQFSDSTSSAPGTDFKPLQFLQGRKLHELASFGEVVDWETIHGDVSMADQAQGIRDLVNWLDRIFGL